ncbi:MAG: hypothetical protein WCO99_04065, partial [Planctomycetota bacterium]
MGILVRTHPFHGHVASGWRARPDAAVQTMGVYWACGGIQLIWSPDFVNGISEMEVAGVLLHEVHHVVLRHMFIFPEHAAPPPDFDAYAAVIAQEPHRPLPHRGIRMADTHPGEALVEARDLI